MKPPFIATQRLWRLVCPPEFQKECLRPEKIWTLPRDGDEAGSRPIDVAGLPAGRCRWERIVDRAAHLADLSVLRQCVTIDAGVGKTTALRQMEYLRQCGSNRDGMAIFVEFAELPYSADDYLGTGGESLLIRKLRNSTHSIQADPSLQKLIERKIRCNKFTLLVDALDQSAPLVGSDFDARKACTALCDFLKRFPEVRCVVSGRPYAIQSYWKPLFQPEGSWEFVKIDLLTPDESERYVGPELWKLLRSLGADVMAIPRSLEMIRRIDAADLPGLRTKSDVYWRSLIGMLTQALADQGPGVGLPESDAIYLFSLIAFEMTRCGFRANLAGIAGPDKLRDFLSEVRKRRKKELLDFFGLEKQEAVHLRVKLNSALSQLLKVNDNLADPVLAGSDGGTVVQLLWRNQTLLDMYAALWLTRYAKEQADRDWFAARAGVEAREELCQLVLEMPRDSRAREDSEVFPKLVAFLFRRPPTAWKRICEITTRIMRFYIYSLISNYLWISEMLTNNSNHQRHALVEDLEINIRLERKDRWPKLIYLVWSNMLDIAGYAQICRSVGSLSLPWEEEVHRCTVEAQREVRQRVASGAALLDTGNRAREMVWQFLGEFPLILRGARGGTARRIAVEFDEGFKMIPPTDRESLTWREVPISAPFELAQYAVTNELYALWDHVFDSRSSHHWISVLLLPPSIERSLFRKCPASGVDWYGAWCCALWLGGYLPTVGEWEYACRADGAYCFGNDESQLGDYAWFDANSGGRAHPVGTKRPNMWGMHDMYGNVWEWTRSWHQERVSRVLRGGAFNTDLRRYAYHESAPPSDSSDYGFRVARDRKY